MVAASPSFDFRLPPDLEAREPIEARGGARDAVRLLVARRDDETLSHHAFGELPELLRPGDALVVNISGTLPAAVDLDDGLAVHFSTPLEPSPLAGLVDGRPPGARPPDARSPGARAPSTGSSGPWLVELRRGGERHGEDFTGRVLALPGGHQLVLHGRSAGDRLWRADVRGADGALVEIEGFLESYGHPIRYAYVDRPWPLAAYQTVFATEPGSAEMPSAGRPFTTGIVTRLVARGVTILPVTLHTGVASPEADEPPYSERFRVPESTARVLTAVRAGGGRVVAVGTTVVRALESAVDRRGRLQAASGWTDLVITPDRGVRVVDGLLSGFHEPRATHLAMLEAVAGSELVARSYTEAVRSGYRWHEFGDVNLYV